MTSIALTSLFCGLAYLLGSIPFGKIVGNRRGIDIQKSGSGNIGFANVLRTLGWKSASIVLIGDVGKGFLPVMWAKSQLSYPLIALVAATALIGHIFPVWLRFKGGKGIATGLGVTLALNPVLASLGVLVYLAIFLVAKKSAVASILAAWSLPVWCLLIARPLAWFYLGLALIATWTHRSNIKQLRHSIRHA